MECRVCYCEENLVDNMCKCKGTIRYVHNKCWILSGSKCSVCKTNKHVQLTTDEYKSLVEYVNRVYPDGRSYTFHAYRYTGNLLRRELFCAHPELAGIVIGTKEQYIAGALEN